MIPYTDIEEDTIAAIPEVMACRTAQIMLRGLDHALLIHPRHD